jgi:hypothetical protein
VNLTIIAEDENMMDLEKLSRQGKIVKMQNPKNL